MARPSRLGLRGRSIDSAQLLGQPRTHRSLRLGQPFACPGLPRSGTASPTPLKNSATQWRNRGSQGMMMGRGRSGAVVLLVFAEPRRSASELERASERRSELITPTITTTRLLHLRPRQATIIATPPPRRVQRALSLNCLSLRFSSKCGGCGYWSAVTVRAPCCWLE